MTPVNRTLTFSVNPAYTGDHSTISFEVVADAGTLVVSTFATPGTNVVEHVASNGTTVKGQYDCTFSIDPSLGGTIYFYESSTPLGDNTKFYPEYVSINPGILQLLGPYLVVSGTLSPSGSADTYVWSNLYSATGVRYYVGLTNGFYCWGDGTYWYITSTAPGVTLPAGYYKTANGATAAGPYTLQGTATGIPAVAAHGNAVLNGFQPDISPATSSALATFSALVAEGVNLNLEQPVTAAVRALDDVPDSALVVGDAMVAAIAGATGKSAIVGTSYAVQTPFTGTVIRTFTLNNSNLPTSRS